MSVQESKWELPDVTIWLASSLVKKTCWIIILLRYSFFFTIHYMLPLFSGSCAAVRKEFSEYIHSFYNFLCYFSYRFPVKATDLNLGVSLQELMQFFLSNASQLSSCCHQQIIEMPIFYKVCYSTCCIRTSVLNGSKSL